MKVDRQNGLNRVDRQISAFLNRQNLPNVDKQNFIVTFGIIISFAYHSALL